LFANSGDFPNIELLKKIHPELVFENNFYSRAQIEFRQSLNTVPELGFPLTDFQRSLWEDLVSDKDVITSAPTSAGKTHIILHYLLSTVSKGDGAFAAVIVPTRALISEVSGKIYELLKENGFDDIEICTVPKEGDFRNKTFFVMTQERLHEVLLRGDISFNYLFIDEAHNIADKSRGVLLHLTIQKMLENSLPQVIISMPSDSYKDSFSTIFTGVEFKKAITQSSPVSKIIISIASKGRELVISRKGSDNIFSLKKGFKGKRLANIVHKFGSGQSNIIYRDRTDYSENFANEVSDLVAEPSDDPLLEEAANYIEEFVHDEYSLAENLRRGVAFHYGPLPSSVRVMVENLVKGGNVKFIACTSTLAEGVNLPAKNLFLEDPKQPRKRKPSVRIEDVKINNIVGRAGRLLHHFSGNIFLFEHESWQFKDYFDDALDNVGKIPTFYKSLNEELDLILEALSGEVSNDDDQYRLYVIANKLIKEFVTGDLDSTLSADELTLSEINMDKLKISIKSASDELKVAAFTLEANPTVGYIQQNKLFTFIREENNLDTLVLPHPNSPDLYSRLLVVCKQLFESGVYTPTESYTLEHICVITVKWVRGDKLKAIISDQIDWDRKNQEASNVNRSVRRVIAVINNDIRFRLSNALKCYQILLDNVLLSRDLGLANVKLHSFIEIGACNERVINLINLGLSREAAIDIDDNVSGTESIASLKELLELHEKAKFGDVHPITEKELLSLFN